MTMQNKLINKGTARFFILLSVILSLTVGIYAENNERLYPGGMAFGIKLYTKGVLIVGISEVSSDNKILSPAHECGLRVGDVITELNGAEVNTAAEITETVESSEGSGIEVTATRKGSVQHYTLTPVLSVQDGRYKAGMWIRDSTAGIGTVTYIDPKDFSFAGLGHGVCDIDTGELLPLRQGEVTDVTIDGINMGKKGSPGEIRGYFKPGASGTLSSNKLTGVYGSFFSLPEGLTSEALPVADYDEIENGRAYIYSTLDNDGAVKYDIEISKLGKNPGDMKNFLISVTDKRLLEKTGGIIQGMSGSPIIQNEKLIGAVTHVLINDPERGYGIYIGNMLP